MQDHERDHVGGSLRPKGARLKDPESALQMRAALSGRLNAVTPHGVLGGVMNRQQIPWGTVAALTHGGRRRPERDPAASSGMSVLRMQALAGNRAVTQLLSARPLAQRCGTGADCGCVDGDAGTVQREPASAPLVLVQREPAPPTPGQHDLTSPRFAGDPILEACFDGKARLDVGARGPAVLKVQEALIALGNLGPSDATGVYAQRTAAAIRKFKADHGLGSERFGDVGPGTMGRLDQLFPPETPTLEPGTVPGQMTAVTTKPAVTDSKGTVKQRPEGAVSVDSTKPMPSEEKEPRFEGKLGFGGKLQLFTAKKGGGDDGGLSFCDHGHLEVSGQGNYTVIPLSNRVAILAEPTLVLDGLPLFCAQRPSIELQVKIVKAMIFEKVEIALLAGVGAKDPLGAKGWLASGGIMVEIPLGKIRSTPISLEFGIQGELPIVQERNPDGTFKENAEVHFVTGVVLF